MSSHRRAAVGWSLLTLAPHTNVRVCRIRLLDRQLRYAPSRTRWSRKPGDGRPPSLRLVWPVRLSVVVTWRRDPTSGCWPSFPPTVPPAGAPFPPLVGSIPPLRRYYETLRLLAVIVAGPAVPSDARFAPSDARRAVTMETTRPPGFGKPIATRSEPRSPPPPRRDDPLDVGRTQCISGLNYAAYGLPVNASRPGSPQAHASLGSGWRPTLAGWDWPTGFRTRFRRSHHGLLSPLTGRTRVVARIVTGPHEAHRQDPHLPRRDDPGRPRAVIRFRISQPRTTALPCLAGLRARRPSPMMDVSRKHVLHPALTMGP